MTLPAKKQKTRSRTGQCPKCPNSPLVATRVQTTQVDRCQVVGVLFVLAGLAMPFIGLARFKNMVAWWLNKPPAFTRVWAVVTLAVGVFFVWAVAG